MDLIRFYLTKTKKYKKHIADCQKHLMVGDKIEKYISISDYYKGWKCNNCDDARCYLKTFIEYAI